MEMYEVGGCVRDEILGIRSKDIDFSVVLSPDELPNVALSVGAMSPFEFMEFKLMGQGFELIEAARKPEHLTARGFFPKDHPVYPRMAADFVLARKEGVYSDGRRPDFVEVGTLEDDLARRDFRMNAIAKRVDGSFVDPFNGRQDISEGVIRAVGSAFDRFTEDALRAVRALRFSVTKGFRIDREVEWAMEAAAVLDAIVDNISDERICDELSKMFRFDTVASLMACNRYPALTRAMFSGSVSLDSTMKTKGRGKS
jgi:tRNA nucleotidyltransferase (CCA-adding enzyme)